MTPPPSTIGHPLTLLRHQLTPASPHRPARRSRPCAKRENKHLIARRRWSCPPRALPSFRAEDSLPLADADNRRGRHPVAANRHQSRSSENPRSLDGSKTTGACSQPCPMKIAAVGLATPTLFISPSRGRPCRQAKTSKSKTAPPRRHGRPHNSRRHETPSIITQMRFTQMRPTQMRQQGNASLAESRLAGFRRTCRTAKTLFEILAPGSALFPTINHLKFGELVALFVEAAGSRIDKFLQEYFPHPNERGLVRSHTGSVAR